jgi:hypothetical protein
MSTIKKELMGSCSKSKYFDVHYINLDYEHINKNGIRLYSMHGELGKDILVHGFALHLILMLN